MGISPAKELTVLLQNGSAEDLTRLDANRTFLCKLAALESITWLNAGDDAPMSATQLVGDMEVLVPMAGLINKDAELARLQKELDKLQKDIGRVKGKLGNEKFVSNAPEAVIAKEREKMETAQSAFDKLQDQYAKIEAL
jgi:valyl-tRNA synthetase